ncbi:hypothetical protein BCR36DRAFT_582472 [Piromyces finnis]|uniref:Extracellular metalloproteinase n=1 Tax=Piromyces finnis TaxID=1754191 RepID=A0A1Y1VCA4_9FUNG|nr:hypothetical protein BCR36DRAFT_582472 [Piromyces finnis]|eukprot:ORX52525.1 hypothetical protein BCR36DRAFT_582472 [Piromyces finnis]
MKTLLFFVFVIQCFELYVNASIYTPPRVHQVYEEVVSIEPDNDNITETPKIPVGQIYKRNENSIFTKIKNLFVKNNTSKSFKKRQDNPINNFKEIAINHLINEIGITRDELLIKDIITDGGLVNVHFRQVIGGKELSNVAANVNIHRKTGNVISYGSTLMPTVMRDTSQAEGDVDVEFIPVLSLDKIYNSKFIYGNQPKMSVNDAIMKFSTTLGYNVDANQLVMVENNRPDRITIKGVGYTYDDTIDVEEKVIPLNADSFDNVYELTVELEDHLFVADISTTTGELYDIYDLARSATFRAVPWYNVDIGEGSQLIVDPENKKASPRGWNRDGRYLYYYTNGNNVKAVLDWDESVSYTQNKKFIATSTKKELIFDYKFNSSAAKARDNYQAAVTNAFYITNILHDFFYVYGFTEKYGNFQTNNWDKGGEDNDQLIVLVQNSSGNNNAYMITGADGKSPRMKLLIYNRIKEYERDPALSNQIIIHEYTHGVSGRLVGGPSQTSCFKDGEADSINEGLSDFFSLLLTTKKGENRKKELIWAKWLSNGTSRKYPYTMDQSVNPLTYNTLSHAKGSQVEAHFGGQVFASIMYDVIWEVIDEYGFTSNILLNTNGDDKNLSLEVNSKDLPGNVRLAKIVVDALKLMPCNPTFIEARDSIFLAQRQFSNFKRMRCALWRGFAARGLGVNAKAPSVNSSTGYVTYTNNHDIPSDC